MIKSKSMQPAVPIEIDLTGPEGNAFVLIGHARRWAKQLGLDQTAILADMQSGDYDHLISVIEKHFGDYIILYK
jgi:hypothetical protein